MSKETKQDTRFEKLRRERRFVIVPVDINIFGEMLLNGSAQYQAEGLPNDAIFVSADRDTYKQTFQFLYMHESFDKVPQGVQGPIKYVALTRINL